MNVSGGEHAGRAGRKGKKKGLTGLLRRTLKPAGRVLKGVGKAIDKIGGATIELETISRFSRDQPKMTQMKLTGPFALLGLLAVVAATSIAAEKKGGKRRRRSRQNSRPPARCWVNWPRRTP
ncbi:MAG: hypothetical protein CM1200mP2_01410 [Planctomycetaceae bacterium]|nr:MAG: hypothetical protein CM1200mP2_01410 [Planctomycetaceae bacterium]